MLPLKAFANSKERQDWLKGRRIIASCWWNCHLHRQYQKMFTKPRYWLVRWANSKGKEIVAKQFILEFGDVVQSNNDEEGDEDKCVENLQESLHGQHANDLANLLSYQYNHAKVPLWTNHHIFWMWASLYLSLLSYVVVHGTWYGMHGPVSLHNEFVYWLCINIGETGPERKDHVSCAF